MNIPLDTIIYGEASEIMKSFPPGSIDLTVTSPPYDNLRDYEGEDFTFEHFKAIALELYRVTKEGGVVVWVVNDASVNGGETCTSARQKLFFQEVGFNIHDTMIYIKNGPPYPSQDKYYQVFEYMFVLVKGTLKTFNPLKDRKNIWAGQKWSKKRTRRQTDGTLKEQPWYIEQDNPYGVRFNVWYYQVGAGYSAELEIAHEHPAIFPEALARDHILSWSNPGDVVLDPMCGSGTTCLQAALNDRRYIGIDIADKYCGLSRKRIKLTLAQQRLF